MLKIAAIVLIAVVLIGLLFVSQQKSRPLIVSGFIEADQIRVGSRVSVTRCWSVFRLCGNLPERVFTHSPRANNALCYPVRAGPADDRVWNCRQYRD